MAGTYIQVVRKDEGKSVPEEMVWNAGHNKRQRMTESKKI